MIIFWDTEYTSWENSDDLMQTGAGQDYEIFQIAAVKLDPKNAWKEVDSLNVLIKPTKNPKLSDYVQKLTGITQKDIEREGLSPQEGIKQFADFSEGLMSYSFGNDAFPLSSTCRINNIPLPRSKQNFHDVRLYFERAGLQVTGYSSGTIHKALNIQMSGHVHNALHDCRSIAETTKKLVELGKLKYQDGEFS